MVWSCFLTAAIPADAAQKPNIIFIMVDDLGPEWISCYGARDIRTQNIDRLAEQGMRFTNAYSMPKCTPTRATLLTGQYPFRHGWIGHWDVPRWGAGCHFDWKHNISFAQVMKQAGYAWSIESLGNLVNTSAESPLYNVYISHHLHFLWRIA